MSDNTRKEPPAFGELPIDSFFKTLRREYMYAMAKNDGQPPVVRVVAHGPYLELTVDPANYKPSAIEESFKRGL